MNHSKRLFASLIRFLIIFGLLFQQIAIPLDALAAPDSHRPGPQPACCAGKNEEVNAYLERVAAAQPELFQQAAMAAIQDAFNGTIPEVSGGSGHGRADRLLSQQLPWPRGNVPPTAPGANSSSIDGDTYRWNSSQTDPTGLGGSAWQMTARPGGGSGSFSPNTLKRWWPLNLCRPVCLSDESDDRRGELRDASGPPDSSCTWRLVRLEDAVETAPSVEKTLA